MTELEPEDVSVTVIDHDGDTRPRASMNNTMTRCEGILFIGLGSGEADPGAGRQSASLEDSNQVKES